MTQTQPNIILASTSPRRARLLEQIGLKFTVVPADIDERIHSGEQFEEAVKRLAMEKAQAVAATLREGIVISADTIVVIDGQIFGKPASAEEAESMLMRLSGNTHTVYTGFAILDVASRTNSVDFVSTEVTFRTLEGEEIRRYVASGSPMDKAGAYGIQDDFGAVFVDHISGDYYTVVGFPLSRFYQNYQRLLHDIGK